jgi:very-short-patch-repair endonuclease
VVLAALAAENWGVLSSEELVACGLSKHAIARRVSSGRLHRIHRGVYAVGHASLPLDGRFLAAVKACGPSAVLSHLSAAALWRITAWEERAIEVTVSRAVRVAHEGIRVHRPVRLTRAEVMCQRAIPVTTPARTVLDLGGMLDDRALRRAVREAQALRLTSIPQLTRALREPGPRRGTGAITRILATGPAPTRSALEDVVLDLILAAGLRHPDVNTPMTLDGRRIVPDFRWPAQRIVLEADGAAWHEHRIAREDDAERQSLLERHGERVIRVTWEQAVARPDETIARLRAAGVPARS